MSDDKRNHTDNRVAIRRLAAQLLVQMPDGFEDARAVAHDLVYLVEAFLDPSRLDETDAGRWPGASGTA